MITFKRLGCTIKLSNADWKGIRRRFDLAKAKLVDKEYFAIEVPCSLCGKYYGNNCERCPVDKALREAHEQDSESCVVLISSYFRRVEFDFNDTMIFWDVEDNKNVRKQLRRLNEIMDKIEADNGWKER